VRMRVYAASVKQPTMSNSQTTKKSSAQPITPTTKHMDVMIISKWQNQHQFICIGSEICWAYLVV
jgi:hypothetical protein